MCGFDYQVMSFSIKKRKGENASRTSLEKRQHLAEGGGKKLKVQLIFNPFEKKRKLVVNHIE